MKDRLLKNWNVMRVIYLLFGMAALTAGYMGGDWIVGIVGVIFTVMGIFSFGCARGNCAPGMDYSNALAKSNQIEVDFEEVE